MDTLTNTVVSLPDTITITTTLEEVIIHSCPTATTANVIFLAITIGIIVSVGFAIIGYYICKNLATTQLNNFNKLTSRQVQ